MNNRSLLLSLAADPLVALFFGAATGAVMFALLIAMHNERINEEEQQRLRAVKRFFAKEQTGS